MNERPVRPCVASMSTSELARKFTDTWQLNVPERRSLQGGPLAGRLLVAAIIDTLQCHGWYPRDWRPEQDFDGGLLELLPDNQCRAYWKAEVGVCQYKLVKIENFDSLRAAALAYGEKFFGANFDGIPIDWSK